TQLPKSQALEFLLVSPVRPRQLFLAEALVGLTRLALVTLAGLPVLLLLAGEGLLDFLDLPPLLLMPLTWGALAGFSLVTWAYEPIAVRRWGERLILALVVLYLIIGVLAGEHLRAWLAWLPGDVGRLVAGWFMTMHRSSPFAVLQDTLRDEPLEHLERLLVLEGLAVAIVAVLMFRAACRLKGHFHDRHYLPAPDVSGVKRAVVGEKPLRWWAVKRVSEYTGRVNLWLAGGFGAIYALYTVAGSAWPAWLGRQVFEAFDALGGIPSMATALVVLAAVPAAYQYGLWDSNAQDRCRRLELLLLTRLSAADYWDAAAAAAWRRGRGYFAVAVGLWMAALLAGKVGPAQVLTSLAAGVILWGLYFVLGFQAFSRGVQANTLGLLLTIGLPVLTMALYRAGLPALAALMPPGSVYEPLAGTETAAVGSLLAGAVALSLGRGSLARCDGELRRWYDQHHGQKVID
ncbi:MAG TPA: hypothetical protein VEL76_26915, partial [Gemmataceae bacterium]|nr:hypothetical protein [Gemmataceae bacterium]